MNINDPLTVQEMVTFIKEHERAQSLLARIPSGPDDRIFLAPDTWMRRVGYKLLPADPPPGWRKEEQ